jgi:glycosyltransferase involved in cell wall biosynthesis
VEYRLSAATAVHPIITGMTHFSSRRIVEYGGRSTVASQQEMPLVSVIIPSYNHAHFVGEAIKSVLEQDYQHYEIILVDDGSTDNTREVVAQFGFKVRYIYQPNQGLSAARNTAIKNARGEIIALLDADDVWLPEFLEKTVTLISNYPQAAMVYSGYIYIDSQGNEVGIPHQKVISPDMAHQTFMTNGNWLVPSAVIFRKNLAVEVGLFEEEIGPIADTDLWMKLSLKSPMIGTSEALIKYRRHDSNMSKDPKTMVHALTKYTEKKYGPLDTNSETHFEKLAAYSKLFQSSTKRYLACNNIEKSVNFFIQLISLDYASSLSMPVWRSFCRAHIPLEFINDPDYAIDVKKMESIILRFLDEIHNQFDQTDFTKAMRSKIRVSAYLALAEEGRIAGNFSFFRKYLCAMISLNPKVIFQRSFWGRVLRYIGG